MPVTLAQLYGGGSGSGGLSSIVAPPKTELELTASFAVPVVDGTDVTEVSTAQYLSVGQFIFLSDGGNYGSFQITAINDKSLTLRNYGGEIVGTTFGAGSRLVPSGRDGNDAVPADVVSGTDYDAFRIQTLNSIGSLTTNKMDKSIYDADGDGIVDSAAGIEGVDVAGNSKYYGTDTSGVEGFHDLPTPPTPTFANLQGLARDNADLESELEGLETAIAGKENVITPGTNGQYWRGDKSWQTLNKSAVGLGNVDNISDLDKPISTATQTALNGKFNNPTGTTAQYLRGDGSVATFPSVGSSVKTKNIESISATKTLTLASEYFQFLTPTVASVIVKLPSVTGSDYFECEIANQSTANVLVIQENDSTAIVTLANTGNFVRSIYAYWSGSIWQVWIRGYY